MGSAKTLSRLAVAAMAVAAMAGVSSASASNFTASYAGKVFREQTIVDLVFSVTGSSVDCSNVSFSGSTPGTNVSEFSVEPTFKECTAFGFGNATVNTAGCVLTFKAATSGGGEATMNLSGCTSGGIKITVNVPFIAKCETFVKNQPIANAVNYSNPTAEDIRMKFTASSIHDEVVVSTGLCALTVGTHTGGTFTGESTLQAEGGTLQYDA